MDTNVETEVADSESVASAVVHAISTAEGTPAAELPRPLFESVDPDALNGLFEETTGAHGSPDARNLVVSFDYHGYRVTVSDDEVLVADG